jgi:hypothetical protein
MERRRVSAIISIAVATLIGGGCARATKASGVVGETASVELRLDHIRCEKTTEKGEDEVFVLTRTWHTKPDQRGGGKAGPWNLNDGGDKRYKEFVSLGRIDVRDGETAVFDVDILEEDGGNVAKNVDPLVKAAAASKNPYAVGAAAAATICFAIVPGCKVEDTDDFIGAFRVQVTNAGGKIAVTWTSRERVARIEPGLNWKPGRVSHRYYMNGDGSQYTVDPNLVISSPSRGPRTVFANTIDG